MYRQKFQTDLAKGKKYEQLALDYFDYDACTQSTGCFKEYDWVLYKDGVQTRVEVKADFMGTRTGNVAVEVECSGKPSGISSTTASIFIYFLVHKDGSHDVYKIPTEELRALVNDYRCISGGDGGRARFHLVRVTALEKYITKKKYIEKENA